MMVRKGSGCDWENRVSGFIDAHIHLEFSGYLQCEQYSSLAQVLLTLMKLQMSTLGQMESEYISQGYQERSR